MNPQMIFEMLLRILADRVLTFVALVLNFGLFVYAIVYPDVIRFAVAGLFSLTCFAPILRTTRGNNAETFRETRQAA